MSTPPTGPTHGDHDADPTGMRDVLASLSDPAPMPRQLADRICASLEQEHQARVGTVGWQPTSGPAHQGGVVHDFAAEKAHRRPQQWIMAAAAVLAVGVIGTVVFDQILNDTTDSSSVAAQANPDPAESASDGAESDGDGARAGSEAAADDQGQEAEGAEQAESQDQADAAAPQDDDSEPSGLASLGDAAFALGAQALLATAASEISGEEISNALPFPDALNVQVGNVAPLDSTEVDNCAQAAGKSSGESWLGLTTTINGEEVVILGDSDSESSTATQAWALDSSCPQNATAAVLRGPVQLP